MDSSSESEKITIKNLNEQSTWLSIINLNSGNKGRLHEFEMLKEEEEEEDRDR